MYVLCIFHIFRLKYLFFKHMYFTYIEFTFSFYTFNLEHFREFVLCHIHTVSLTLVKFLKTTIEINALKCEFFQEMR